jgi:hypothetical protein
MRTALATAIVALVTLSASNAIAACKQAALKGTWQYTALDVFENSQSLAFTGTNIEDCTFKIDKKGTITNVSCSDISADVAEF